MATDEKISLVETHELQEESKVYRVVAQVRAVPETVRYFVL
jgi:hypothetical protein